MAAFLFVSNRKEDQMSDEWESAEHFQAFFADHPEIQDLMGEVGVTTAPDVMFWRQLDTQDAF
jgi:hypothetical protein